MKHICGILLLLLFYCSANIPMYSSHPLEQEPNQTTDDDDFNFTYNDYGLEPEDGDMTESYIEPSAQEDDIAEFVSWATKVEDKKSSVSRVDTWRPSQKDVSDISVQSIGSIQSVHLKCQPSRGCNNCYKWINNGLYPAPCPGVEDTVAVAVQSIPSSTCLLLFVSISIFSFSSQF